MIDGYFNSPTRRKQTLLCPVRNTVFKKGIGLPWILDRIKNLKNKIVKISLSLFLSLSVSQSLNLSER